MPDPRHSSGAVYRISVSPRKGTRKENIRQATVIENRGIMGDAHAGSKRQISLLPFEAFDTVRAHLPEIAPGDFAENITTRGMDFSSVAVGDRLRIGTDVRLVVTQIGKECHDDCYIKRAVGQCIMPRLGVFASIVSGGSIRVGDKIEWENDHD